jgi:translation initiation factor 1 (eIF-1/SUI1)
MNTHFRKKNDEKNKLRMKIEQNKKNLEDRNRVDIEKKKKRGGVVVTIVTN